MTNQDLLNARLVPCLTSVARNAELLRQARRMRHRWAIIGLFVAIGAALLIVIVLRDSPAVPLSASGPSPGTDQREGRDSQQVDVQQQSVRRTVHVQLIERGTGAALAGMEFTLKAGSETQYWTTDDNGCFEQPAPGSYEMSASVDGRPCVNTVIAVDGQTSALEIPTLGAVTVLSPENQAHRRDPITVFVVPSTFLDGIRESAFGFFSEAAWEALFEKRAVATGQRWRKERVGAHPIVVDSLAVDQMWRIVAVGTTPVSVSPPHEATQAAVGRDEAGAQLVHLGSQVGEMSCVSAVLPLGWRKAIEVVVEMRSLTSVTLLSGRYEYANNLLAVARKYVPPDVAGVHLWRESARWSFQRVPGQWEWQVSEPGQYRIETAASYGNILSLGEVRVDVVRQSLKVQLDAAMGKASVSIEGPDRSVAVENVRWSLRLARSGPAAQGLTTRLGTGDEAWLMSWPLRIDGLPELRMNGDSYLECGMGSSEGVQSWRGVIRVDGRPVQLERVTHGR
jgi:hypothetical protein